MSTPNTRARRLRLVATLLLIATVLFTILWSWLLLRWVVPQVFGDLIYENYFVEEGAQVTIMMRAIYGSLWFITIGAGLVGAGFAVQMLWRVRAGEYFTERTALSIKRFGLALVAAMICDTVLAAFGHSVLTWGNAPLVVGAEGSIGYVPPTYYYDSGDITVLLCGIGFFLIGWILQEGGRIETENRGFV